MTKEEAARRQAIENPNQDLDQGQLEGLTDVEIAAVRAQRAGELHLQARGLSSQPEQRNPELEKTMSRAQRQADKSERGRRTSHEEEVPDRTLGTQHDGAGGDLSHLPVVEEVGEANSTGGRSNASNSRNDLGEKSRSTERPQSSIHNGGIRQVSASTTNSDHANIDGALESASKKSSQDLPPGKPQSFFEAHLSKKVSMAQGEDLHQPPQLTSPPESPAESPVEMMNGTTNEKETSTEQGKRRGTT
jgi:hypothetical protein